MRFRTLLTTASALALGVGMMASNASAGNSVFVEQVGNDNFAASSQEANGTQGNETYVHQQGNFNSAGASTDLTPGNDKNNTALIHQNGNRNLAAWSFQSGSSGSFTGNTLGIVQTTNKNYAQFNLAQDGNIPDNTSIFVEQRGGNRNYVGNGINRTRDVGNNASNGSTRTINLVGMDRADFETSSAFSVPVNGTGDQAAKVRGDNHQIGIYQSGTRNALALEVSGSNNYVGGPDTVADFGELNANTQSGGFFSGNPTVTLASAPFGINGPAKQVGNDNQGVIGISGSNNAVSFKQTGNDTGEVYQSGGSGNLATVSQ